MNYIEAICHYCEENSINRSVTKLITKPMKEKLRGKCNEPKLFEENIKGKFLAIPMHPRKELKIASAFIHDGLEELFNKVEYLKRSHKVLD